MRFVVSLLMILNLAIGIGPAPAMAMGTPCHEPMAIQETAAISPHDHAMHEASAPKMDHQTDRTAAICKALCATHCLNACPGLLGPEGGIFASMDGRTIPPVTISALLEGLAESPPLDPPRSAFV